MVERLLASSSSRSSHGEQGSALSWALDTGAGGGSGGGRIASMEKAGFGVGIGRLGLLNSRGGGLQAHAPRSMAARHPKRSLRERANFCIILISNGYPANEDRGLGGYGPITIGLGAEMTTGTGMWKRVWKAAHEISGSLFLGAFCIRYAGHATPFDTKAFALHICFAA